MIHNKILVFAGQYHFTSTSFHIVSRRDLPLGTAEKEQAAALCHLGQHQCALSEVQEEVVIHQELKFMYTTASLWKWGWRGRGSEFADKKE